MKKKVQKVNALTSWPKIFPDCLSWTLLCFFSPWILSVVSSCLFFFSPPSQPCPYRLYNLKATHSARDGRNLESTGENQNDDRKSERKLSKRGNRPLEEKNCND